MRLPPAVAGLAALAVLLLSGCGAGGSGQVGEESLLGYNEIVQPGEAGNELLAGSGAAFARIPINWAGVEPVRGERNFAAYDAIAAELDGYGLRPLWVLTSAPCWAATTSDCTADEASLAPAAENVGAYADFALEVAKRYPDALGIEVWNEPNISKFWREHPDPALYRELLTATIEAIHGAGSDVPVVLGGLSPVTAAQAEPGKIPAARFLDSVLAGPGSPAVDAIGLHPYSFLLDSKDPVASTLDLFRDLQTAAEGDAPGIPIWVTEVGLTTAGRHAVTEAEQARDLSLIVRSLAAEGVPVIAVHRFFDEADPPFPFEAGFGVVGADHQTLKPAYCALAELHGVACP